LKAHHPESYSLLSNIPVPAHAAGDDEAIYQASPKSGYPVLNHDPVTKELYQVRWNNDDRSVMDHLDPEIVEKWY
jgi:trimethyllysine dioxygenase